MWSATRWFAVSLETLSLAIVFFFGFFTCSISQRIHPDICLSSFKCEEFKESLRGRMRVQYYRFGNFEPGQRHCVLRHIEKVCSLAAAEDCISLEHLDHAVIYSLGECIPEMKLIRDRSSRIANRSRRALNHPDATSARFSNVRRKRKQLSTDSLPYGSPLRRIARLIGLEAVSGRFFEWNYDCDSGAHWCCVFIGDDQDFSCFQSWCPGETARCT